MALNMTSTVTATNKVMSTATTSSSSNSHAKTAIIYKTVGDIKKTDEEDEGGGAEVSS